MKHLMLVTGILMASQASHAYPSRHSKCNAVEGRIKHPDGLLKQSELLFNHDCSVVYIKPPKAGIKTINLDMVPSMNLQNCASLEHFIKANRNLAEMIESYTEQLAENQKAMAEQRKLIRQAKERTSEILKANVELNVEISTQTKLQSGFEVELEDLKESLRQARPSSRPVIKQEIARVSKEIKKHKGVIRHYQKLLSSNTKEIRSNEKLAKKAKKELKELQEFDTNIIADSAALEKVIKASMSSYSSTYGSSALIETSNSWDDSLIKYRNLNPQLGTSFKKLPIKNTQVLVNSFDEKKAIITQSAVIGRGLPDTPIFGSDTPVKINIFDVPNVRLDLSLNGACPFYDSEKLTWKDMSIDSLKSHFIASVLYSYDVYENENYDIQYNLEASLTKITETLTKSKMILIPDSLEHYMNYLVGFKLEFHNNIPIHIKEEIQKKIAAEQLKKWISKFSAWTVSNTKLQKAENCKNISCQSLKFETALEKSELTRIKNEILRKHPKIYIEKSQSNTYTESFGQTNY